MRILSALIAAIACAPAADLPLVARYAMDDGFRQSGGAFGDAQPGDGVSADPNGKQGGAWRFAGRGRVQIGNEGTGPICDLIGSPITVAIWVKPDALPPQGQDTALLSKRMQTWHGYSFQLMLQPDGNVRLSVQNGCDTVNLALGAALRGEWTHLAFTHAPDGDLVGYRNGAVAGTAKLEGTLSSVELPLLVGNEDGPGRLPFTGLMDDLRIYAAPLSAAQVAAVAKGDNPPTRAATAADIAPNRMPVVVKLVRFDMPLGFKNRDGGSPDLTRMVCRRIDGEQATDWPTMRVGDQVLFADGPEQRVTAFRRLNQHGGPLFQQKDDPVITPGNHWFRPVNWLWGHTYVYTTDSSIRCAWHELEVWTFPVRIAGSVTSAKLVQDGRVLYDKKWDAAKKSLILCVPQNKPGPSYELWVNGQGPVRFDAGLKPVTIGDPREEQLPIDLAVAGCTVRQLDAPEWFPFKQDWREQGAAMQDRKEAWPQATALERPAGIAGHLGIDVPRAPVRTYSVSMTHGMSGGHWLDSLHGTDGRMNGGVLWPGDAEAYASFLADQGIDAIYEWYTTRDGRTADQLAAATLRHGVQVGFNLTTVNNSNLMFYARALPDFWLPKLRDVQLVAQHVAALPNLAGLVHGADNGGYVPYWDWAPPIPNRPWGEAFLTINGTDRYTVGPAIEPNGQKGCEVKGTEKEFLASIAKYDATFEQFGLFSQKAAEVDPRITLTNMSYGNNPGVGGSGGWPWASVPGKSMFATVPVLQTYDWDETDAERPLHNAALMDRLKSWYPEKPAWMLLDNFFLKYGREARQRVMAYQLTRGLDSIGHNWMPQPTGPQAKPEVCAAEKQMWSWIHRMSGAYAGTKPVASIGIVFSHQQGISRQISGGDDGEKAFRGSHDGKTIEALLIGQLAGWPTRLITVDELARGAIPADMQALVLVGLNRFDGTWLWSDGCEPALKAFAARGGRLLLDDESVLPAGLQGTATGMRVMPYHNQGPAGPNGDKLAFLIDRNRANADKLRTAMAGAAAPLATAASPTVWPMPHRTGDMTYVTVTNWTTSPDKVAARQYTPATAALTWNTQSPIYDLARGKRITAAEAASCDLTTDAMRLYAVAPGEIGAPTVKTAIDAEGFLVADVAIPAGGKPCAGIPIEIVVSGGGQTGTLWGASGKRIRLPVASTDGGGTYQVAVTELLSRQKAQASAVVPAAKTPAVPTVDKPQLARFLARKDVPVSIALTKEQGADAAVTAVVDDLAKLLKAAGRTVKIRAAVPGDTVVGVQAYTAAQGHPKWSTVQEDLVLLGTVRDNALLYDQALGGILLAECYAVEAGKPFARVTYSPFVGSYHCLNLFGANAADLAALAAALASARK